MARESSLPYPQQSTTCSYPEPDSVQALPSYLYKIHFNITFLSFYASIFQVVWFIHVPLRSTASTFPLSSCYMPRQHVRQIRWLNIIEFLCSTEVLQYLLPCSVYSTQNPVTEVSYIKCTQHSRSKSFIFPVEGNRFTCRNTIWAILTHVSVPVTRNISGRHNSMK
jgi:hypothetical protein